MRPQTFTNVPSTRKPSSPKLRLQAGADKPQQPNGRRNSKKSPEAQPSRARTRQSAALSGLRSWSAARSTASGWPMKPRALEDGAGQRASVVSLRVRESHARRKSNAREANHRVSAWCRQAPQVGRRRAGEAVGSCSSLWARTWRLPTMVTSIALVEPPADRRQPRRTLDAADAMAKVDDDEARCSRAAIMTRLEQ